MRDDAAALLCLLRRTTANRVMHQVRRLRKPRYLIGAVAAAAYCWMFFYRQPAALLHGGDRRARIPDAAGRPGVLDERSEGFDIRGRRGRIVVTAIYADNFAGVPQTKSPDQVTLLEEDKIAAYYGAGLLYAHPGRAEPLL